jgi:AraC family transcriptional regulator
VVDPSSKVPKGMSRIEFPARECAVFEHLGHITAIATTYAAIWDLWSAESLRIEEGGLCVERHKPNFDPSTGFGGVEIWMPLQGIET